MNLGMIRYLLGWVMNIEAALLLLPCTVAVIYGEADGFFLLAVAVVLALFGTACVLKQPKNRTIYAKEGFVTTALAWILLSVAGAMPFFLSGAIPSFVDALFETVSGFTTTGATILTDIEGLHNGGLMFWRSFTHWIGGMGVLVFMLAVVPLAGGQSMVLMRAESPGPSVGKLVPKLRTTAMILYGIYLVMTLIEVALLLVGGMPLFDALTVSFGTAGTGGFAIKNLSMGAYNSYYLQGVVTVFMLLFGVNFVVYYLLLTKRPGQALRCEEVRWYFGTVAVSTAFITFNILGQSRGLYDAFHQAAFQVSSIITTTGFSTVDFNSWPELSRVILVILMFIGACAGSTGGGIKVGRFVIMLKTVKKELSHLIHPRNVKVLKMDGKPIPHETVRGVNIFFIT